MLLHHFNAYRAGSCESLLHLRVASLRMMTSAIDLEDAIDADAIATVEEEQRRHAAAAGQAPAGGSAAAEGAVASGPPAVAGADGAVSMAGAAAAPAEATKADRSSRDGAGGGAHDGMPSQPQQPGGPGNLSAQLAAQPGEDGTTQDWVQLVQAARARLNASKERGLRTQMAVRFITWVESRHSARAPVGGA